jgi:hypothetical protein
LIKLSDELEPGVLRLPVLIKIHQAKCKSGCPNVDPLFNNGLMYIRIADIPESTMKLVGGVPER